ncbi:MAG TPA: hypothetical protein VGN81_39425 [Pseudonocardiaceae bacterium]
MFAALLYLAVIFVIPRKTVEPQRRQQTEQDTTAPDSALIVLFVLRIIGPFHLCRHGFPVARTVLFHDRDEGQSLPP